MTQIKSYCDRGAYLDNYIKIPIMITLFDTNVNTNQEVRKWYHNKNGPHSSLTFPVL